MQVKILEYDGSFEVTGLAEGMQEAATIVRMGMQSKKGCRMLVSVSREGAFRLTFMPRKAKNARNYLDK